MRTDPDGTQSHIAVYRVIGRTDISMQAGVNRYGLPIRHDDRCDYDADEWRTYLVVDSHASTATRTYVGKRYRKRDG